jgi:hypothetical protein
MTNIIINNKQKDMQLHIDKARSIIAEYLPTEYVDKVLEKLPADAKVSKGTIRNVKNKASDRLDVLNAMVEVALEHKALQEKLIQTIT